MKNKIITTVFLLLMIALLSGCSEHERLINDGWTLDEYGEVYSKTETIAGDSQEGLELLEKNHGVWMDETEGSMYAQIDSSGIYVEGFEVNELYDLSDVYIESTHTIWPNDNGDIVPLSLYPIPFNLIFVIFICMTS